MPYGVNTEDGYAKDYEADSPEEAIEKAERIVTEEYGSPKGTRYEVWDTETDMLVAEREVTR